MEGICYYGLDGGHCYDEVVPLCQNGFCEQCCGDGCGYHSSDILDRADFLKKGLRESGSSE